MESGTNNAPEFTDGASTTRSVAENTAAGENVGTAVAATDDDSDTLTYTLEGTDAASFDITPTSGQILTKSGVTYDFETTPSYSVTVTVSDGNGGSDSIDVTINLTDVSETEADVLISNTGQSGDDSFGSVLDRAQQFTTGSNTGGYNLSSVDVISEDSEGDEFTVDVYTVDADGFPDTLHASLTSPGSFAAGTLNFTAPSGTMLAADTTYTVLIEHSGTFVRLDTTTSDGEDSGGAAGWSIADAYNWQNSSDEWATTSSGEALRIAIQGTEILPTEVPADWSLIPSGLSEGDQFRLLFISSEHRTAAATDIATYNTWVQDLAKAGHTDIQDYSSVFRAVGSTEDMDARDNTRTTGAGVAIYWLGGNKVADDYADFYDESWDEEASMKNESGTAETGVSAWTGSDHDGTEFFNADTTSRALGNSNNAWVAFGKTNSDSHGPLSGATLGRGSDKRIYGLSDVFVVVAANTPATGTVTISGTAQVGEVLTAEISAIMDAEGVTNPTFSYQWVSNDGTNDADISGATESAYWPSASDVGKTIKVKVTFNDDEDNAEELTSEATDFVVGAAVTAVPADWSLIPSGLSTGERFRLIFVSSATRNATPTDIATYNTWIQVQVAAGHADIRDYSSDFKVVGSTATVDARDNTGTTWTDDEQGVPIYWLNGNKVADQYKDFYDESWDDEVNPTTETGAAATAVAGNIEVYTGSSYTGEAYSPAPLGGSYAHLGILNDPQGGASPLDSKSSTLPGDAFPFYGLSGVFSVSPPGEIVYSAVLTVEVTGTYVGFDYDLDKGSLDPFLFSYDGQDVGVYALNYTVGGDLAVDVAGHSRLGSGSFNLYLDGLALLIEDPASDSDGFFDFSNHGLSWTNGQIVRVWLTENREPTLTISGTALVGQTLTAEIDEPDGLPADDQITYQWIRDDGTTETDISGATDSTYTLVDDDEDKTIKVEVSYTDNANFAESLTSEPTAIVTTGPSLATVTVSNIMRDSADVTVTINNPESTSQTVYLQYKKDIAGAWTSGGSESTTSTSVEFSLSNLTGNTDYDVRASLDSNFASGVVEEGFKTSPVEPRKLIVRLHSSGDGTLRFVWGRPQNGGSVILDYTVQWKGPGQNYDSSRQATPTSGTYDITGLTNGDGYTARVRARNAVGSGEWSDEVEGTPSTTPDAPVVGVAPGNEQLTVSWDAPGTGGSAITGYTVQLKDSTVTGWPSASVTEETLTGTPPATSHTFTGLTNDTAYTVRARATNANGDGDWSGDATGTPVSGPSVSTVTVSNITETTANVTVAVANLQGARKTVHLQYKKNSDSAWTDAGSRSTTGTDVEFSLTSLDGNTDYDVRASLEQDFSAGVVEETFTTSPIEPDPPTGLNILLVSSQTLLVEWTAPMNTGGSDITGYKVQWKSGNQQFGSSRQLLAQHTATSGAVTSLSNGTEYTVRVLAFNNIGDSASSNEVQGTPVGPPEPPASVSAGPGDTKLTVTWSQTNDGGSDITAYRVQLKRSSVTGWPSGSVTEAPLTGSPPDTFHTFTGLTNDIAHTVRVKATNTHGDSGWSDEVTGTPRSGPAVASVKVNDDISCTVTWIALEFANLDEGTRYQAHLRFRRAPRAGPSSGRRDSGPPTTGTRRRPES